MSSTFAELSTTIADCMRSLDDLVTDAMARVALTAERNGALAEPFIGKKDAAGFLNMSVTTLERRMAEKDGPPRYIDGGKVNFLRSELKSWRAKWRVGRP